LAKSSQPREIDRQAQKEAEKNLRQNVEPIKEEMRQVTRTVREESFWQGPVPHPENIKKFDAIYPGAAKLIFGQYEKQSNHRMKLESFTVRKGIRNETVGMIFAFVIMVCIIGGGIYLMAAGKDGVGLTTSLAGFGGVITLFLVRKRSSDKELREKSPKG